MTDLATLSDDELAATLLLLGERAQRVTNATAAVRGEIQRRATPDVASGLNDEENEIMLAVAADVPALVAEMEAARAIENG